MGITENNYQLKEVIALEQTGTTQGGANKPLFITAFNQTQDKTEEFVLKYRGAVCYSPFFGQRAKVKKT